MTILSLVKFNIKLYTFGVLLVFFFQIYAPTARAVQIEANSCSKNDVESAIAQVQNAGGGVVYIPPGDSTWTGSRINIEFNGNIEIIGAGKNATIIRPDSNQSGVFAFNSGYSAAMPFVRLSNLSIIGKPKSGYPIVGFYSAKEFRLDHVYINTENTSTAGTVMWKNTRKGVVDNCKFVTNTTGTSSCSSLQAYGLTPSSCYDPYPTPASCYSSVCDCSVGSRSVYRESSISAGNTIVARLDVGSSASALINNSGGSGTGKISRVYIYIASVGSNPTIDLASFSASGNVLTTRGIAQGIPVHQGLNLLISGTHFSTFDINNGDYVGVYLRDCTLASGSSLADGGTNSNAHWIKSGDQIPSSNVDFGTSQANNVSLWAEIYDNEGDLAACESDWEDWWGYTDPSRGGGFFSRTMDNTWKPSSTDDDAIFVEDCYFKWYYASNEGNWGSLHRVVYRNNKFILPVGLDGPCTANASRITMKPGGAFAQIYNNSFDYYSFTDNRISFRSDDNTINLAPDPNGFYDFRDVFTNGDSIIISRSHSNDGTVTAINVDKTQITVSEDLMTESAGNNISLRRSDIGRYSTACYITANTLIYNNNFTNFYRILAPTGYKEFSDFTFTPVARPHHMYMWNNTYNNVQCGSSDCIECAVPYQSGVANGWVGLNHNMWFRAPKEGESMYGFAEYIYPHPLRTGDLPDNYPPIRSNGQPSSDQLSGTTQVSISLVTNEEAVCKCSTTPDVGYESMTNTFTNTGSTTHSTLVTGLEDGNTYSYYVKCSDTDGIYNTDDFIISFKVNFPDITPPVISNLQVDPSSNSAKVIFQTDEPTTATIYSGGNVIAKDNENVQHTIDIPDLEPETEYVFTLSAIDMSGNITTEEIQFTTTEEVLGWVRPSSVHSACSMDYANNLIDMDTSTDFQHWNTENHWIILDMNNNYTIKKIRMYHREYYYSRGIAGIYVSENATDWGDSLGSLPEPETAASEPGWRECDIIDKKGRYIKLVSENVASPYWTEFEAYISVSESSQSHPDNPTGLEVLEYGE